MKRISLEEFIEERIKENSHLFTSDEMEFMMKNKRCMYKVYLLGAINSRDCFQNDQFL